MAQKVVDLPGVGQVTLSKRRGAKNLRLTIKPDGKVRVGMPVWVPYSAAVSFALKRRDWINQNLKSHQRSHLKDGDLIGKTRRLRFEYNPRAARVSAKLGIGTVTVKSPYGYSHPDSQSKAMAACERALRIDASDLLGRRLDLLAERHGFRYKSWRAKKMTSRWGSCSSDKVITLNIFLVQLPWELIDYVIVHELLHTEYLNHSRDFWQAFEKLVPDAKKLRRQVNQFKPVLGPGGLEIL